MIRAGRYWIPHWYKASHWIAYWDMFGRPPAKPRYARGVPETWWYDRDKASKMEAAAKHSERGPVSDKIADDGIRRMTAYIIRRLLFMIPTLFGIMLVSFVVVQFAPGGPVERVIAQLSGSDTGATSRISGSARAAISAARGSAGRLGGRRDRRRNIAARRGSIPNSSRSSRSSSASTSRPTSASS